MKYSLGDPCRRSGEEIVARQIFLYAVHCGKLFYFICFVFLPFTNNCRQ